MSMTVSLQGPLGSFESSASRRSAERSASAQCNKSEIQRVNKITQPYHIVLPLTVHGPYPVSFLFFHRIRPYRLLSDSLSQTTPRRTAKSQFTNLVCSEFRSLLWSFAVRYFVTIFILSACCC